MYCYLQIPITLQKEPGLDPEGREVLKCGFKIGGGIDQDYRKSPQGYTDNCNGYDFTMVTHKKAVDYIKKHPILNLLVARKGVTST
uniref:Uncharacterized protein n=1 Tax=Timema tahoe TaxID=61484 RepID=A0A7R9ILM5_9NEOP|nr:unnamed protein product [Timema tahoe]